MALAVSGNNVLVACRGSSVSTVGEYEGTTGAAINANFITGLDFSISTVALYGNNVFVAGENYNVGGNLTGAIGEYDATTGATINANFTIIPVYLPSFLAISGDDLFVTDVPGGGGDFMVTEYGALTGRVIDDNFLSPSPYNVGAIAFAGNSFFVEVQNFSGNGSIGQYAATTGQAINADFIQGNATAIAVGFIPEPSAVPFLVLGAVALLGGSRRSAREQRRHL